MTETITLSFSDYEYYDPNTDREVLRMMATTPTGTYYADVHNEPGKKQRERRQAFKEYVLGCLAAKQPPHEIEMG